MVADPPMVLARQRSGLPLGAAGDLIYARLEVVRDGNRLAPMANPALIRASRSGALPGFTQWWGRPGCYPATDRGMAAKLPTVPARLVFPDRP